MAAVVQLDGRNDACGADVVQDKVQVLLAHPPPVRRAPEACRAAYNVSQACLERDSASPADGLAQDAVEGELSAAQEGRAAQVSKWFGTAAAKFPPPFDSALDSFHVPST